MIRDKPFNCNLQKSKPMHIIILCVGVHRLLRKSLSPKDGGQCTEFIGKPTQKKMSSVTVLNYVLNSRNVIELSLNNFKYN